MEEEGWGSIHDGRVEEGVFETTTTLCSSFARHDVAVRDEEGRRKFTPRRRRAIMTCDMMGYSATDNKEEVDVPSVVVLGWIAIAVGIGVEWLLRPPWCVWQRRRGGMILYAAPLATYS